jgi:hypothetical protein
MPIRMNPAHDTEHPAGCSTSFDNLWKPPRKLGDIIDRVWASASESPPEVLKTASGAFKGMEEGLGSQKPFESPVEAAYKRGWGDGWEQAKLHFSKN